MLKISYILYIMLFLHLLADYNLQKGWLSDAKKSQWWVSNSPESKNKYDYIAVLAMHSFTWSFMIMLPSLFTGDFIQVLFLVNALVHMAIDHLKANLCKINLIVDQLLHLLQILFSYVLMYILF